VPPDMIGGRYEGPDACGGAHPMPPHEGGWTIDHIRRLWRKLRPPAELSSHEARFLQGRLPYLADLAPADQQQLQQLTALFVRHKKFEGAGGMLVDQAVRLTIAGQACLLHLRLPGPLFPTLRTVIVYPGTYQVDETIRRPEGVELAIQEARAGESWSHGTLVLSWEDVLDGFADPADGWNVVFHEFAHQLDSETGETNGAPALAHPEDYATWQHHFRAGFELARQRIRRGEDAYPFDEYDTESPAEYFAAASELFFELPAELKVAEPAIYRQLVHFYRQDPAARRSGRATV